MRRESTDGPPLARAPAEPRATFICRGCYRECPANPRLKPGTQMYCGRPSCQLLRKERWEKARLGADPGYLEHRRAAKAASRRKCGTRSRPRRPEIPGGAGSDGPGMGPPRSTPAPPSSGASRGSVGHPVTVAPGWFLIRPAGAPESATQTVEIALVLSYPSSRIEQVSSAPETDAFLMCRSAS